MQPDGEIRADTVGRPAPQVEIRIDDNGEVLYRSPGVFLGYYKDAEKTAETKTRGRLRALRRCRLLRRRAATSRSSTAPRMSAGCATARCSRRNTSRTSSSSIPTSRRRWRSATGATASPASSTSTSWRSATGPSATASPTRSYQELAGHPLVYDMIEKHVDEVNRSLAARAAHGRRADPALPHPAQGARRRRRRADAHPEGAPRLHRRALRARSSRRSTTARAEADIAHRGHLRGRPQGRDRGARQDPRHADCIRQIAAERWRAAA